MTKKLETFFDKNTYTLTYVVYDEKTKDALIIDPVLDYDPASGKISHESIEKLIAFTDEKDLTVHAVLETHAHADHLSGANLLKIKIPHIKVAIGKNITKVQELFSAHFNLDNFQVDGSQFDILLDENEPISFGAIEVRTLFTPGHTPACSSYLIEDMLFTGDALFMPDFGTGRCDFPAGSAEQLYDSIKEKLYTLPESTRVFTGHDYQPNGRELKFESSIGENKEKNIQLRESTSREEFIEFRNSRDKKLQAPTLLLPSIQVNIDAGKLPQSESNGKKYLKIPLTIES
jgi:glyoxylase-like metal-dependent hydrolase (beta-lactamase superfamily II)